MLFVLIQNINRNRDKTCEYLSRILFANIREQISNLFAICMPRIAGINIPDNKRIEIALTYIYGIGRSLAGKILAQVQINPNTRANKLTTEEINRLREIIEKNYKIEGELRREKMMNIKRLKDIGCYRGIRHIRGLPVRGQRTRTNTRTVRGNVRKTMGSGRRRAAEKTQARAVPEKARGRFPRRGNRRSDLSLARPRFARTPCPLGFRQVFSKDSPRPEEIKSWGARLFLAANPRLEEGKRERKCVQPPARGLFWKQSSPQKEKKRKKKFGICIPVPLDVYYLTGRIKDQ